MHLPLIFFCFNRQCTQLLFPDGVDAMTTIVGKLGAIILLISQHLDFLGAHLSPHSVFGPSQLLIMVA